MNGYLLWIAQGFGLGRIPIAPGTFGSLAGLVWFAILIQTRCWAGFLGGTVMGLGFSVWICGLAEVALGKKDPGSVVIDEITAIPLCFIGWLGTVTRRTGVWPRPEYFLSHWPMMLVVFLAFRFFDILKPWPVRQSQSLPGGWGVTVDDALAAIYVNGLVLLLLQFSS